MTTDVSRRVLRNWARRVTKSVTRNFVVASRTSPGSSRAGRMMSEIASPAASGSLAAASSPERAKEKEFSTSLIIISSILANYRFDLTVKIMSRKPRAMRKKGFPILLTRRRTWFAIVLVTSGIDRSRHRCCDRMVDG